MGFTFIGEGTDKDADPFNTHEALPVLIVTLSSIGNI
jgi:hypothetical protein